MPKRRKHLIAYTFPRALVEFPLGADRALTFQLRACVPACLWHDGTAARSSKREVMKKAKKIHGVAKAPIMIKLAEALDEATGNAIEVYQLLQEDGTYVKIEVGREIACDFTAFRKELNKKPSLVPRDRDGAKPIIAAATMKPPKEQWLYPAQLGWRSK